MGKYMGFIDFYSEQNGFLYNMRQCGPQNLNIEGMLDTIFHQNTIIVWCLVVFFEGMKAVFSSFEGFDSLQATSLCRSPSSHVHTPTIQLGTYRE